MVHKQEIKIGMVLDKPLPDMRVEHEAEILGKCGFSVILLSVNYAEKTSYFQEKENYTVFHKAVPRWFIKKLRPFSGTILDVYSLIWWLIIKRFVRDNLIDVLHLHDLYMGIPVLFKKIPFIIDLHENYPETIITYNWSRKFPLNYILTKSLWKKKEKTILGQANGIVVLSSFFAKQLQNEYNDLKLRDKFFVYPNVPDLKYISGLSADRDIFNGNGKFTIFYYGVIAERRGIFECFKALNLLKEEIDDIHFLIVGPVDNADKRKFYDELDRNKNSVTHIPWVEFSDFASLVKDVELCISPIKRNPQHESGVANKIFQYMYFQKPLLVSNCLPQREIVEEYNCGYVYLSGNVSDLADKIRLAYSEKKMFSDMGERAKLAVENKFNTEIIGHNLCEFYYKFNRKGNIK